jgi:hypothetical protein
VVSPARRTAPRLAGLLAAGALAACAPRATVVPGGPERPTTFRYAGPGDAVALVGDMTGWSPAALARSGGGWALSLPLPPGRYEYRLEVRRGGRVEPAWPAGAERVEDGYGGENAVLRVGP